MSIKAKDIDNFINSLITYISRGVKLIVLAQIIENDCNL